MRLGTQDKRKQPSYHGSWFFPSYLLTKIANRWRLFSIAADSRMAEKLADEHGSICFAAIDSLRIQTKICARYSSLSTILALNGSRSCVFTS